MTATDHPHVFDIPAPHGSPTLIGTCRCCGLEREFPVSHESKGAHWKTTKFRVNNAAALERAEARRSSETHEMG